MALDTEEQDELHVVSGTTEEQARAHKDAKNRTQARLQLRGLGGGHRRPPSS